MMQKQFKIQTNDSFIIYGTLDSIGSNKLIIFVHGLTGSQNEHQYFNAAPFFNEAGFDVVRFSFYESKEDARSLTVSSLNTHVTDLRLVIDKFKGDYDEVFLVGHSLGALVVLKSELSGISKIVLWDPSSNLGESGFGRLRYVQELDRYVRKWGKEVLLSMDMVEQWQAVDMSELVEGIKLPVKFIFAGDRKKYDDWKLYLGKIQSENDYAIVEGATHVFVEDGAEEKLFKETLKWIR